MPRPVVLVVTIPYVGATAFGYLLDQRGHYDVVVADLDAGGELPSARFDAVLTTLPVPTDTARVVIELPWNWKTPVLVTVDGASEQLEVTSTDPIGEVLDVLDHYVIDNHSLGLPSSSVPS